MKTENIPYKIYLSESEMPQNWYNVRADMKNKPAPLVNPGTGKPVGFDETQKYQDPGRDHFFFFKYP